MTFRKYIQLLAEQIGLHQIPVVYSANEIRFFLAEDAVHHKFVTKLIRDIYKRNGCGHLDACIDPKTTMSMLGVARAALLIQNDADICQVSLMNQLCEVSTAILNNENQQSGPSQPTMKTG